MPGPITLVTFTSSAFWLTSINPDHICMLTLYGRNVFDDMCRIGRWPFWFSFDVNLSIFDADVREKTIFTFLFPATLTFDL